MTMYALSDTSNRREGKTIFTGLIEEVGKVRQILQGGNALEITIACEKVLHKTQIGDSIAVNGVCLTVTRIGGDYFSADIMPETKKRTTLAYIRPSSLVNLERALVIGQRLGGHMVQGHVDGTATLVDITSHLNGTLFRFRTHPRLTDLMVERGSVAVNGVSLTLVDVETDYFTVSVIPHTLNHTQFKVLKVGDLVNVECDIVGKYLAKWTKKDSKLDLKKLEENGFLMREES